MEIVEIEGGALQFESDGVFVFDWDDFKADDYDEQIAKLHALIDHMPRFSPTYNRAARALLDIIEGLE